MNLVIQGAAIESADAAQLAALCAARSHEQIGEAAWRLRDVAHSDEIVAGVAAHCTRRTLDFAWIAQARPLAELRLIAMDMDSTLITIECIDEIGGMLGIKDEIAAITTRSMRGEIDFSESLRRRVALLAGLPVDALEQVYRETLRLSPGAERLFERARALGIRTLLVSGGFTFFTDRLKDRLGLDYTLANVLEIGDGKLTGRVHGAIVDANAKAARVIELRKALGIARAQTLAIGDGANDLPMLAEAGVSVAWRAKPVVRAAATHALDHSGLDAVLNFFE